MDVHGADPPNGQWGWIVTFVSFMVGVIMDGISYSFGILFNELLLHFHQGKSVTSWIISVFNAATLGVCPVASILVSRYGEQKVSICGSLLASTAVFLATFSPNVYLMILLFGLIGGSGLGVIYFSSIVMISQYFSSKRGLASGIALCGSGVGTFIFAPLMEYLITRYSWQGAVWIMSALILNCVPLGALLRPLNKVQIRKIVRANTVLKSPCNRCVTLLRIPELLKSPFLIIYGTSSFLCNFGFYIPVIFLPVLAEDIGMTSQQSSVLIAVFGIMNTAGRVIAGFLTDRPWMTPITLNMVSLIAGGVATTLVSKYIKFLYFLFYCALFGLVSAVFHICQPIISLELSGIENISSFYGMICFFKGVAALIGAPLAGMLTDTVGNYEGAFYMTGITITLAGLLCLPLIYLHRRTLIEKPPMEEDIGVNNNCFVESTYL